MRDLEIMESLKKDPGRTDWQRDLGASLNWRRGL